MESSNLNPVDHTEIKGHGALDAFLNLFSLISLGWLAISFSGVLYNIVDKFFPGVNTYYDYMQGGLKFALASTIILLPVFFGVINSLHRQYKQGKLNHSSGIYRWLTYAMLLISALSIVGSLVALIFNFLNGVYTTNVILKILVVFVIASGIFGYYFYDLRRHDYLKRSSVSMIFGIVSAVVAIASIVGGIMIIDSPSVTRAKQNDQQRVTDLTSVAASLDSYYSLNQKLPENLSEPQFGSFVDPLSKKPYDYQKTSTTNYKLCATFELPASAEQNSPYAYPVTSAQGWNYHASGYQCFDSSISPSAKMIAPTPVK